MREINIYTPSKKLISIMNTIEPLTGFKHKFHSDCNAVISDALNVIITGSLQKNIAPSAKYILCSKEPQSLSENTLANLYDLWPLPLTPSLIKFLFRNILIRIKFEIENSAEHIEHQKRILEMARQDYLTGLATRWYLQDFIERNRHERNITCIYFDLDNFKSVNDTFGHQAGDRALAATAEMMQREFPEGFASRMGGDEFMLVLLGRRDISELERRVNEFMSKLLKYYSTAKTMKTLSVSAGISQSVPNCEKTIDQIIHEADRALYEAKKSGKAQCKVYGPSMG